MKDVRNQFHPVNHNRGQQKRNNRQRTHTEQQNVDGACNPLPVPAVAAVREMEFIVRAHRLRSPEMSYRQPERMSPTIWSCAGGMTVCDSLEMLTLLFS